MPRLTIKQLAGVISELRTEWGREPNGLTPEEINGGYCGDFAGIAWERLGCPIDLQWGNYYVMGEGHTWLRLNEMHFDAECPDGVTDWRQLPFFQRFPAPDGAEPELD